MFFPWQLQRVGSSSVHSSICLDKDCLSLTILGQTSDHERDQPVSPVMRLSPLIAEAAKHSHNLGSRWGSPGTAGTWADKDAIWADWNPKLASTRGLEHAQADLINSGLKMEILNPLRTIQNIMANKCAVKFTWMEEQFVQIPRSIIIFIANDQSVIEQLKLIKLLGLSLHHGGQLVKISVVCDSHKYIYSRWQGDELMFLSRRPSLLGGDHIASRLIQNLDTIKTWQALSLIPDAPTFPPFLAPRASDFRSAEICLVYSRNAH